MGVIYSVLFHRTFWKGEPSPLVRDSLKCCSHVHYIFVGQSCTDSSAASKAVIKYGAVAISRRFRQFLLNDYYTSHDFTALALSRVIEGFYDVREAITSLFASGIPSAMVRRCWRNSHHNGTGKCFGYRATIMALQ